MDGNSKAGRGALWINKKINAKTNYGNRHKESKPE